MFLFSDFSGGRFFSETGRPSGRVPDHGGEEGPAAESSFFERILFMLKKMLRRFLSLFFTYQESA